MKACCRWVLTARCAISSSVLPEACNPLCLFLLTPQGAALYTDFSVFPYTQEYPAGLAHKAAAVARREAASDAPA